MDETRDNKNDTEQSRFGGLRYHTRSAGEQSDANPIEESDEFNCSSPKQEEYEYDYEDDYNDGEGEELLHFDQSGKPFKCMRCGKRFSFKGNLTTHIRVHTGSRPYVCPQGDCGQRFTQSSSLKSHICSHLNNDDCSKEIRHYLKYHSLTTYECEICGKVYTTKQALKYHGPAHLNCSSEDPSKRFARQRNIDVNRRKHNPKRPFRCPMRNCSKAFTQRSSVNAHVCTHMKGMNQECSLEIQDYLEMHHFEKYICSLCGKVFSQNSPLKIHIRTHSREDQFVCEFEGCGKSFLQEDYLELHAQIHSEDRPYKCTVENCDKAFTRSCNLNIHLLNHDIN